MRTWTKLYPFPCYRSALHHHHLVANNNSNNNDNNNNNNNKNNNNNNNINNKQKTTSFTLSNTERHSPSMGKSNCMSSILSPSPSPSPSPPMLSDMATLHKTSIRLSLSVSTLNCRNNNNNNNNNNNDAHDDKNNYPFI